MDVRSFLVRLTHVGCEDACYIGSCHGCCCDGCCCACSLPMQRKYHRAYVQSSSKATKHLKKTHAVKSGRTIKTAKKDEDLQSHVSRYCSSFSLPSLLLLFLLSLLPPPSRRYSKSSMCLCHGRCRSSSQSPPDSGERTPTGIGPCGW